MNLWGSQIQFFVQQTLRQQLISHNLILLNIFGMMYILTSFCLKENTYASHLSIHNELNTWIVINRFFGLETHKAISLNGWLYKDVSHPSLVLWARRIQILAKLTSISETKKKGGGRWVGEKKQYCQLFELFGKWDKAAYQKEEYAAHDFSPFSCFEDRSDTMTCISSWKVYKTCLNTCNSENLTEETGLCVFKDIFCPLVHMCLMKVLKYVYVW